MKTKIENWLMNLSGAAIFALFIKYTAPYITLIQIFKDASYPAQALIMLVFTFVFFIFIIGLKLWILKDKKINKSEKIYWYTFASPFALIDGMLNIVFGPLLLLQAANTYNEGWLFTSHCKSIKFNYEYSVTMKLPISKLETARYWLCENVYGKIMNMVQKGHYS